MWQRLRGRGNSSISAHDKIEFITQHLPTCQCPRPFPKSRKAVAAALSHWLRLYAQSSEYAGVSKQQVKLVNAYDCYLKDAAGLPSDTRGYHRRCANEFLTWVANHSTAKLDTLNVT